MIYTYVPAELPSFRRWRNLYRDSKRVSVIRALEYEHLGQLRLAGRVLDVGGGRRARYNHLLPSEGVDLDSLNIDVSMEPTYLVRAGESFPIPDNSYDAVLSLNTLEHIYDPAAVLSEVRRILRQGGMAHVSVPFIFRVHGHPDDFTRATPSWWRQTAERLGFSEMSLMPLVWGRYTTAGMISGYRGLWPRGQFHVDHFKDWLYARVAFKGARYDGARGERISNISPGWFISLTK